MFRRIRTIIVAALVLAAAAGAGAEEPYAVEWMRQLGTSSYDDGYGVAADHFGNIYISGYTRGSLAGPTVGYADAFLVKLTVPEPATILIVTAAGLPVLLKRRRNA